ncbi:paramyosin, long form-like [Teleopsis dalmanni]|uniref:paramyosin, long form-like n=1 Tax=Teleopsis dalmanni TaxID=139649 RepID=UPI0018CCAD62|nr:paramyosin, long form-like [Teleopsis dalmanni]
MSSSQAVRSSKYSYRATSTGPGVADINIEYSADLSALSRLEDKIRLLQDDLEVERELRQRKVICIELQLSVQHNLPSNGKPTEEAFSATVAIINP